LYELDADRDVLKVYLCTKMKFVGQGFLSRLSKIRARTGQTDTSNRTYYHTAFTGRDKS